MTEEKKTEDEIKTEEEKKKLPYHITVPIFLMAIYTIWFFSTQKSEDQVAPNSKTEHVIPQVQNELPTVPFPTPVKVLAGGKSFKFGIHLPLDNGPAQFDKMEKEISATGLNVKISSSDSHEIEKYFQDYAVARAKQATIEAEFNEKLKQDKQRIATEREKLKNERAFREKNGRTDFGDLIPQENYLEGEEKNLSKQEVPRVEFPHLNFDDDFLYASGIEAVLYHKAGFDAEIILTSAGCFREVHILAKEKNVHPKVLGIFQDGLVSPLFMSAIRYAGFENTELLISPSKSDLYFALDNSKIDAVVSDVLVMNDGMKKISAFAGEASKSHLVSLYRSFFQIPCTVLLARKNLPEEVKNKMVEVGKKTVVINGIQLEAAEKNLLEEFSGKFQWSVIDKIREKIKPLK